MQHSNSFELNEVIVHEIQRGKTAEQAYLRFEKWIRDRSYVQVVHTATTSFSSIGHSIEREPSERIYLREGERMPLAGKAWTVEPRIARRKPGLAASFERIVSLIGERRVFGEFGEIQEAYGNQ